MPLSYFGIINSQKVTIYSHRYDFLFISFFCSTTSALHHHLKMPSPLCFHHSPHTVHNPIRMLRLHQEEIVPLRSGFKLKSKPLCTRECTAIHEISVLHDIEIIRPPRLVLIIDHAGTCTVIFSKLHRKYELILFPSSLCRWHNQSIIRIGKDYVTSLQQLFRSAVPLPSADLAFCFLRIRKIQYFRIEFRF